MRLGFCCFATWMLAGCSVITDFDEADGSADAASDMHQDMAQSDASDDMLIGDMATEDMAINCTLVIKQRGDTLAILDPFVPEDEDDRIPITWVPVSPEAISYVTRSDGWREEGKTPNETILGRDVVTLMKDGCPGVVRIQLAPWVFDEAIESIDAAGPLVVAGWLEEEGEEKIPHAYRLDLSLPGASPVRLTPIMFTDPITGIDVAIDGTSESPVAAVALDGSAYLQMYYGGGHRTIGDGDWIPNPVVELSDGRFVLGSRNEDWVDSIATTAPEEAMCRDCPEDFGRSVAILGKQVAIAGESGLGVDGEEDEFTLAPSAAGSTDFGASLAIASLNHGLAGEEIGEVHHYAIVGAPGSIRQKGNVYMLPIANPGGGYTALRGNGLGAPGDGFGSCLGASGDWLVVGAQGTRMVYVYKWVPEDAGGRYDLQDSFDAQHLVNVDASLTGKGCTVTEYTDGGDTQVALVLGVDSGLYVLPFEAPPDDTMR